MSEQKQIDGEFKYVQSHPCSGSCRRELMQGDCCAHNQENNCEYYTNWLSFQKQEETAKPKSPWTDWEIEEIRFTGKPKQPLSY